MCRKGHESCGVYLKIFQGYYPDFEVYYSLPYKLYEYPRLPA